MRHLQLPTDTNGLPFKTEDVFDICISVVKDTDLKARLNAIRSNVESESEDYSVKAINGELYQKTRYCNSSEYSELGFVSKDEMINVYKDRMVPKKSPGRKIYDKIMLCPINGKCPLCGIGTVSTLDHYLPKAHYPVYSITPHNLVPVCEWCQKKKGDYYPAAASKQLLHPYFDDMDRDIWLMAEVCEVSPVVFRYYASPPDRWSPTNKERVTAHITKLKLCDLFASNAGSQLAEMHMRLADLFEKGGEQEVCKYLQEELLSLEADQKNSWKSAMYRAAIASRWFCNGGFLA